MSLFKTAEVGAYLSRNYCSKHIGNSIYKLPWNFCDLPSWELPRLLLSRISRRWFRTCSNLIKKTLNWPVKGKKKIIKKYYVSNQTR